MAYFKCKLMIDIENCQIEIVNCNKVPSPININQMFGFVSMVPNY